MNIVPFDRLRQQKGIPYSKVHLGRLEKAGLFPKRIQLGPNGRVAWLEHEIDAWIEARAAAREVGDE